MELFLDIIAVYAPAICSFVVGAVVLGGIYSMLRRYDD